MSGASREALLALQTGLPELLKAADLGVAAAERALGNLLLIEATAGDRAVDPSATAEAREALAGAVQRRDDLRLVADALPSKLAEARTVNYLAAGRITVTERKARKKKYLEAVEALSNRRFIGVGADEVKRAGRDVLELAKRAGRVQACKDHLLEIAAKPGAHWLEEVV